MAAEGYSIYIKGLPYDATPALLEDEFKKFGAIKNGGIQVRSKVCINLPICLIIRYTELIIVNMYVVSWQQGFCFGFVEFEEESAVHNAVKVKSVYLLDTSKREYIML